MVKDPSVRLLRGMENGRVRLVLSNARSSMEPEALGHEVSFTVNP